MEAAVFYKIFEGVPASTGKGNSQGKRNARFSDFTNAGGPYLLEVSPSRKDQSMSITRTGSDTDEIASKRHLKYGEPIDSLAYPVVEIDRDSTINFANRATCQIFGYDPALSSFSIKALQFLVPEDRARAEAEIIQRFDGGGTSCHEYIAQAKDGSRFHVALYFSPVVRGGKTVLLRTFWLTL